tara:strand:- start:251 stop:634 length:384 start_codon:yes stop_codon:yes gene_type:complete
MKVSKEQLKKIIMEEAVNLHNEARVYAPDEEGAEYSGYQAAEGAFVKTLKDTYAAFQSGGVMSMSPDLLLALSAAASRLVHTRGGADQFDDASGPDPGLRLDAPSQKVHRRMSDRVKQGRHAIAPFE